LRYALLLLLVGCIDPIDQQWQLDHDRVVVARATPPRIHAGDMTNLDALVAHDGGPTTRSRAPHSSSIFATPMPAGRWSPRMPRRSPRRVPRWGCPPMRRSRSTS
jgi:hypothetical protein